MPSIGFTMQIAHIFLGEMSKESLNSGFCIQDDWISPHDSEAPKLKPPELTMRYDQNASNLGMQSADMRIKRPHNSSTKDVLVCQSVY